MRATVLEPAVSAGVDPVWHAREIRRVREAVQSGAGSVVFPPATRAVIRQVIRQDWDTMLRQGVNPRGVAPQFLDSRELENLRDDPDLVLTWRMLTHHLGLVRDSEFMATASDARGCVVWTGGNMKVRDEASRYGFSCGAQWAEVGTNGIRLVTQSLSSGAQIYGPEHWMDFQDRWTCTTVGVFDPHTCPRRLRAVINVTGLWTKVHSDTLGWLYEIAQRIEDALRTAHHRTQWGRLGEAAGLLERIDGPALVIDSHGVVVAAQESVFQAGDRVIPTAVGTASGLAFLPGLGWCVREPLPARGWLVRSLRHDEDKPVIQATLDLTDPTQPWVRVTGPNVSWRSRVRPLHAKILQLLAGRPDGLTPAQLQAELYGASAKFRVPPEMAKLRKELGGLLHPTSHKPGDNRYRFCPNVTVNIHQGTSAAG
ncbi:MAG: hypothetical protein ACRDTJ_27565 [Pseudonocardiaceae bacterium]